MTWAYSFTPWTANNHRVMSDPLSSMIHRTVLLKINVLLPLA